jgi:hypothetical protein
MAVEVRRWESRLDHSIDLRKTFAGYIRRIQKSEGCPSDQRGQRVEFTGIASRERRRGGEGAPDREIQVKAE